MKDVITKLQNNYSMLRGDMPHLMEHLKEELITPLTANTLSKLANETITVGLQESEGKIIYVLAEEKIGKEKRGILYSPVTGDVFGVTEIGGSIKEYPIIDGKNDSGELLLSAFFTAIIHSERIDTSTVSTAQRNSLLLLFEDVKRSLKNGTAVDVNTVKTIQDTIASIDAQGLLPLELVGNKPSELNARAVKNGTYAPTNGVEMELFGGEGTSSTKKATKKDAYGVGLTVEKWLKKYGSKYFAPYEPNQEEKRMLEIQYSQCKDYLVTESVVEILLNYHKGGIKKGYLIGEAGTGKSTDCLISATLLNLVYITQVYNYETSSSDLLVRVMPKTSETTKLTKEQAKDLAKNLLFNPSGAYNFVTGKTNEDASVEDVLMAMIDRYSISGSAQYYTVDSPIVESARRPRFLEMQEVPKLRATGILGSLNGLYDNQGGIRLPSGEYVKATTVSCTYITSNGGNYVGNNDLPADFKSRFAWHPVSATLSVSDMVKRLFSNKEIVDLVGSSDDLELKEAKKIANTMAKAVKNLQKEVIKNDCYNVSISFREYEAWFRRFLVHPNDILGMAKETVIASITVDDDEMKDYEKVIDSLFK